MGGAARQDEGAEQQVYPAVFQIFSTPDEIDHADRNREIGERNDRVGQHIEPKQGRGPIDAESVRDKIAGIEQAGESLHGGLATLKNPVVTTRSTTMVRMHTNSK